MQLVLSSEVVLFSEVINVLEADELKLQAQCVCECIHVLSACLHTYIHVWQSQVENEH